MTIRDVRDSTIEGEHLFGSTKLMQEPSPWQPENDKMHLAVLGKLGEECGELSSAISRCVIQGVAGFHPVTRTKNIAWLQEELADVLAGIQIAIDHFGLDVAAITRRSEMKKKHKLAWHKQVKR